MSCPGRGLPWKYLRQRSAPRVTARRCPMRRTPSRRRQFEGRPLAGALSRGRVDGCIRSRRPTSRGADELVGHRRTTAARSTMSKTKAHGRLPEGVVLDPLRRCMCNAASIRETLSRPDAIHTQVGRNAHRLLLLPRALPSRWGQGPSSVCKGGLTLQPEAVEQMQLRGRRRIDGVGRPKFDFYTGLRGTGLRGTLLRALASAARRRRPALRARSSCAPRAVVWPRVSTIRNTIAVRV